MTFRSPFSRFLTRKKFKPFGILFLCFFDMAVLGLCFSAGLLVAEGRLDRGSTDQPGEINGGRSLPGETPETPPEGEAPGIPGTPEPATGSRTGALPGRETSTAAVYRMAAIPASPRPGEPVTVALAVPREGAASLPSAGGALHAVLAGEQGQRLSRAGFFALPYPPDNPPGTTVLAAVLAVPSTVRPGKAFLKVEPPVEGLEEIPLTIGERDFVSETIDLDAKNTNLRAQPDPQKTAEAQQLWAILRRPGDRVYSGEAFDAPVSSTRRTSFFGDRRVYRYIDGSMDIAIHAGIDFGVPKGTPVYACAEGKVVLAQPRIVTGNSVIIEHFPGLYSLYYHLDSIAVSEGAVLGKGTLLGESGSTGLATGPHLHWEIRAAGENTDPDAFMSRAVLDKTLILSKLFE
jgi:murein DD-endopeptidase MepM/ murein hydrolase activator NlpD